MRCEVSPTTTWRWRRSSPRPQRFGSLRERVRGRDGEDEAHAADRQAATAGGERRGIGRAIRGADREVGAPRQQRVPGAAEHFVGDAQARRRARVEALERGQQRVNGTMASSAMRSSPSQPPASSRTRCARSSTAASRWRPSRSSVSPADVSLRTVAAPVEQQHVELALEAAHRVGDRRRHLVELGGGAGEAAAARDRLDQTQGLEVERRHAGLTC